MRRYLSGFDRIRMIAAIVAIEQAQINCRPHVFNPPIIDALNDGETRQVCKKCGLSERVTPTVAK
jgi:hypothetical protein